AIRSGRHAHARAHAARGGRFSACAGRTQLIFSALGSATATMIWIRGGGHADSVTQLLSGSAAAAAGATWIARGGAARRGAGAPATRSALGCWRITAAARDPNRQDKQNRQG